MAKAKARELRELGDEALKSKIKELDESIFNMRIQLSMGKLENTAQIRAARRQTAMAKTFLKQSAQKAKA